MEYKDVINQMIKWGKENIPSFEENELSDGWHTFNDLYEFRKLYNAVLFNEWADRNMYQVHKSIYHNDGELCFGGGWFIVVAILPTGQISNHYKMKDWDLFKIPAKDRALYPFDGHTPQDVMSRLLALIQPSRLEKPSA
jgi:hypothetical protein